MHDFITAASSNPNPSPYMRGAGGSAAFGSPIGSPESLEHGPFQPPQPHVLPAKSALRRSRPTMDEFRSPSPPFEFPQAEQMPHPGVSPYGMPQNPYVTPQNPYLYAGPGPGQQSMPQSAQQYGMPLPYMNASMGPTPRSMTMSAVPTPTHRNFPMARGQGPMTPGYGPGMSQPGMMPQGMTPQGMIPRGMTPQGMMPRRTTPQGMMPQGMMPQGMMPQPGMRPHLSDPAYHHMEGSQRQHRHKKRRRHRGESSSSASSSEEGIVPDARYGGNPNPLPQPPRAFPVPAVPAVSPNGSILVDSPPATGITMDAPPPIPPKPPPNPLPTPPKSIIGDAQKSAALLAAADDVRRAKERTERARDKAIARLEADTWEAAGVPIGVNEDGERYVPLIPGKTAPAVYSNVGKRKKKEESDEEEEEDEEHHNALGGLTSLLKRMSTRHKTSAVPPPVAPKPDKAPRASKQFQSRPSMMPTHNSDHIPREEGIFPRGTKFGRSMSVSHLPLSNEKRQTVDPNHFTYPHTPGLQTPMQYDEQTQEYFDPTNGLWWNPNTRKYYNRRAPAVVGAPAKDGAKKEGGGLRSMIKRWTTNTAPDHQPKPITAQLIIPKQPGATVGLKGGRVVSTAPSARKSMQQPRISVFPDHSQALGHGRSRTTSALDPSRGAMPWGFPPGTANDDQPGAVPNGWPPTSRQAAMAAAAAPVSQVPQANVYFSRKSDVYGGFRLDSSHAISWGGVDAPTAEHWFESGRYENVGTGLGADGMGSGWTFPSTKGLRAGGGRKRSRFLKALGKGSDERQKGARLEYARARTEYSESIMRLRTSREIQVASATAQLSGVERRDWQQVWPTKLEEILYLKLQQHPDLLNLLLGTGTSRIIFNHEDSLLGDGGNVNGHSNNGQNELGKALMRVRKTLLDQLTDEQLAEEGE